MLKVATMALIIALALSGCLHPETTEAGPADMASPLMGRAVMMAQMLDSARPYSMSSQKE